jgi:hypothetical protein
MDQSSMNISSQPDSTSAIPCNSFNLLTHLTSVAGVTYRDLTGIIESHRDLIFPTAISLKYAKWDAVPSGLLLLVSLVLELLDEIL